MKIQQLATILGCALACTGVPLTGHAAEPWPTKPVVIYVPYQAGGSIDTMARPIAAKLAQMWGQPVIVENRPGANGMLATQTLIRAPADGHTLLYHITGIVQNPILYKNARYDPTKDVTPIVQIGGQAMGLSVPVSSPYKTLGELIAAGKSGRGGQSYGSVGNGHTGHVWSALLASETGMNAVHVAYKGSGPMVMDLLASRLDWAFLSTADALTRSTDKAIRVLALSGPARAKQFPNVATLRELGYPGFEMVGWHGIFAPVGISASIAKKIEQDLQKVLADPELIKLADSQVIELTALGQEKFSEIVKSDYERWGALMRKFDIRND